MKGLSVIFTVIITATVILCLGLLLVSIPSDVSKKTGVIFEEKQRQIELIKKTKMCEQWCNSIKAGYETPGMFSSVTSQANFVQECKNIGFADCAEIASLPPGEHVIIPISGPE